MLTSMFAPFNHAAVPLVVGCCSFDSRHRTTPTTQAQYETALAGASRVQLPKWQSLHGASDISLLATTNLKGQLAVIHRISMSSRFVAFKKRFQGDIVTTDSPDYDASIARWAANAARQAKFVCFVKGAEDVAIALKFARDEDLKIAIRGGGHDPAGSSSQDGGLIIDLSKYLNNVTVDVESRRAMVGGGALWEAVDNAAIAHGFATVGGTVNHTGVGGLCLGGGYGWLCGEHGLVVDNLLEVTIVIADGSVLKASSDENPELFWAVRGGGSNFGVCVEFVLQLHEQRRTVYSGLLIFPSPLVDAGLDVTESWWKAGPGSKEAVIQIITQSPPPDYHPCVVVIPFYNGSAEEGREKFKMFLDLNPIDMTKEMPYEALNTLQNEYVKHGKQIHMRGVGQTTYSSSVAKQIFAAVSERSTPDLQVNSVFELFPRSRVVSVSESACAFNTRGPAHQVLLLTEWADASDGKMQKAVQHVEALTNIMMSNEETPKDLLDGAYPNYIGEDVLHEYAAKKVFGGNYPRLQMIKKKYDPDMLFCKWLPIRPE